MNIKELYEAIGNQDISAVKSLLQVGVSPNDLSLMNLYRETPLHKAVNINNLTIVNLLLQYNAFVDAVNFRNETSLLNSAFNKSYNISQALINAGANLNIQDMYGDFPLLNVVESQRTDLVKLYLSAGANVDLVNRNGMTPLHIAAANLHDEIEILNLLLNKNHALNVVNIYGDTALHIATSLKNSNIVTTLLTHNPNVNIVNNQSLTPLLVSAIYEDLNSTSSLMNRNVDINVKDNYGNSVADFICKNQNAEQLRLIITKDLNVNTINSVYINQLTTLQHEINYALDNIPNINLQQAVLNNNLPELQNLVNSPNIDINYQDPLGKTALHYAVDFNQTNTVNYLLSNNANINTFDFTGYSPYLDAIYYGYSEILNLLLNSSGAGNINLDDTSKSIYTPLQNAIMQNETDISTLLITKGANASIIFPNSNKTILHYAVNNQNLPLVNDLINIAVPISTDPSNPYLVFCTDDIIADEIVALLSEANATIYNFKLSDSCTNNSILLSHVDQNMPYSSVCYTGDYSNIIFDLTNLLVTSG
jgi:ankyrin repeat protein